MLETRHSPTRDVGRVFGSGTDPCRLAGEVARLPGALVEGALTGSSPESDGLDTTDDAPLASAITRRHTFRDHDAAHSMAARCATIPWPMCDASADRLMRSRMLHACETI